MHFAAAKQPNKYSKWRFTVLSIVLWTANFSFSVLKFRVLVSVGSRFEWWLHICALCGVDKSKYPCGDISIMQSQPRLANISPLQLIALQSATL